MQSKETHRLTREEWAATALGMSDRMSGLELVSRASDVLHSVISLWVMLN